MKAMMFLCALIGFGLYCISESPRTTPPKAVAHVAAADRHRTAPQPESVSAEPAPAPEILLAESAPAPRFRTCASGEEEASAHAAALQRQLGLGWIQRIQQLELLQREMALRVLIHQGRLFQLGDRTLQDFRNYSNGAMGQPQLAPQMLWLLRLKQDMIRNGAAGSPYGIQ
jgi:hypothetical protein